MKNKLILIAVLLICAIPTFAQKEKHENKEQMRKEMLQMKLDFLAADMELKEDQKKQFDELYSQMESERRAVLKKMKKAEKAISQNKNASEADYEKATQDISDARAEMVQIEKRYDEKFSTFLSKKQMFKMKEAENKFMQKMQDIRHKKKSEKKK